MKKVKLNYRIHNPNSAEVTAEYIAKILVEANRSKLETVLRSTDTRQDSEHYKDATLQ